MSAHGTTWTNWVGNQTFAPLQILAVDDEEAVATAVRSAGTGVRTFGTGHSFTPIVETAGVLLDTSALRGIRDVDHGAMTVTVGPKTAIGELGEPLWAEGLALANQGDIDTQAIAGAIATATHGSGVRFSSFSGMLEGARYVDGTGAIVEVNKATDPDVLAALQTSIGLLGIMTSVTIGVVPAYRLYATVDVMSYAEMIERFEEDVTAWRHYGFFWMPTEESAALYNLKRAEADTCVVKRYREADPGDDRPLGPNERLDRSYRVYPMVYDPNFHEMEYFLPLETARSALGEMRKLMRRWHPSSVYPMEVRVVGPEDAWMSPNHDRANLVVSISGQPGTDYWPYLRACDSLFAEFHGRPHWGKLHFMTADRLDRLFPRYQDFVAMRRRFDPAGIFLNDHTRPLFE